MKRLTAVLLMLLMLSGIACAQETEVFVSITNGAGEIVLAHEKIAVSDADADGTITMHDALLCAHTANYAGEEGYLAEKTEYGLSLVRLWGEENGGSFGYFINHQSAWSLLDPVAAGDHVKVYAFTDMDMWSDTYCFFDVDAVTAQPGETVTLSLYLAAFDDAWNPVTLSADGAVITVNGERTDSVTNEAGQAQLTFEEAGIYVISAVSDTQVLVLPVCIVTIEGK